MSDKNNLSVGCNCGAVQGTASNITSSSGNRVVCCCSDCQAFASFLGKENEVLDEFGGTDLYQTSQSQVDIHEGLDQLKSMRLTPKGMLRWYAGCCNTPVGNTMSAGIPFVGLVGDFLKTDDRDRQLGSVRAFAQLQHAKGEPSYPHGSQKFPLGISLRIARQMLSWKIRGMHRPSVFFDDNGRPTSRPTIANS